MENTNVVFFDDLNKVVKLIPLNYFKGKIEIPDKRMKTKSADKKIDFYGIGFTSRTLFELYLDEAIYLGSKEALSYKRMWAGISADKYFDGGFAYPVQCIV